MLRSMYAGISGMKGFQTKLDVIGNNIANVNTPGFKKGRVTFEDLMSQTTSSAQGATDDRGGINAKQVGIGAKLGSIDNIHTQGFSQTTDNPLDLQLEGDGMFALDTPEGGAYTRSGNFYLDEDEYIVNADGYYLLSTEGNRIQVPDSERLSIATDGTINDGSEQEKIGISLFSNPAGLEKISDNLYKETDNAGMGDNLATAENNGAASIVSGALEMSNVDLSEEFTEMITAQRGFQANTRIITTSDEILQELVNLKR